jgi:nucleoside-diphosphate-sugar epimerase
MAISVLSRKYYELYSILSTPSCSGTGNRYPPLWAVARIDPDPPDTPIQEIEMSDELVLVTGGSGFIAQHCIVTLLQAGYRVRTTLRSLSREAEVRKNLSNGGIDPGDRLSFVAADLTADNGWSDATAGCAYVIHGASPTPSGNQVREAERASWDFIDREGNGLELATVNPTTVLGPALGPDYSHSIRLIKNMIDGQPGCPKVNTCVVDVRDVADLHLRAMTDPNAKGQRFLAAAGESLWLVEIAQVLKQRLGAAADKISTRILPNWVIRLLALTNPAMKAVVPHLGVNMNATSEKARRLLGWKPRSRKEAIVATAESLIHLGLVKGKAPDRRHITPMSATDCDESMVDRRA